MSGATPEAKKQSTKANDRHVVTPTILQMEAAECGAAALGMVLAYYGRIVPLEQLRVECGVSRDGSKAANLLRVARKYGLEAKGYKREPSQLRADALPLIVFWNFNHFVVVEGFRRGCVLLNDPAAGRRSVTDEEFDRSFTGVALLFSKTPEFQPGGEAPSRVRALSRRLRGSRRALLFVVLVGLCLVVPGIVIPTFSRIFIDNVLIARAESWLRPLLMAMLLTGLFRAGATWLQQRTLLRLEMKLSVGMSSEFFWHVLRLPVSFFSQRSGGEIGTRVAINDKVAQLLSGELASTLISILTLLFFVLVMFEYDVTLTFVALLAAVLDLVALKYVSRKRVDTNRILLQDRGKMLGTTMSGIQMIETLKGGGSESEFFVRWSGYLAKAMNGEQRLGVSTQVLSAVPPFLGALSTLAILSIGSLRVMNGQLSIGMLIAFLFLATSFIEPINRLVRLGTVVQEIEGGLQRLDDVLGYPQDPLLGTYAATAVEGTPSRWSGHLELRNVTFGYNPLDPPLIENLSLTVRPGQRVALVGMSGSGKSTVSKLVAGLYEPWSGQILFDGQPRSTFPRSVVSNSLAMVDQDIFLFQGSIRDNVTMWDTTVAEATLVRAAKDARVHEDITARPRGYEGAVDESGRNFSGGQRQRLEIARALVLDPAILVLDEATSALDPQTEKELDDQLRQRGCSCLIVAHRLSTIRDCDEIIVLDRGKVVQRGTHDEMKDVQGAYATLIAS